jgi:hypothetical protein
MSSPATSVNQVLSDVVNALLTVFDALAQAISQYAPLIVGVLITVGIFTGLGYAFTRVPFFRRILGLLGL